MNWFAKLLDKQIKKLGYSKSFVSPTPLELGLTHTRLPDPAAHDYHSYTRAYADKAWVYACISIITDTVSSSEIILKNEKGKTIDAHPVLNLLYKPNSFMSGRNLKQWITGSLELTGNAYVLKDARKPSGTPSALYPLLPHLVEIKPSKNPQYPIKGYTYRVGGQTAFYNARDVIHFRYYNPFDFFYGLSPLAAARTSADTLDAAETYNRSFFDNSATISGILQTEQKLDNGTRTRIMKAWHDKYRGESKAHKVALLEGGLKWQSIGVNQKDMDFIAGMKLNRETLLAVFGVPPALVGLFEHAPQFNTKEQQRIFWQGRIIPKLNNILETMTEFLLADFDDTGKLYFEPNLSEVAALRESQADISRAAEIYHRIGFTRDEIIDALGLPFAKEKTVTKKRN